MNTKQQQKASQQLEMFSDFVDFSDESNGGSPNTRSLVSHWGITLKQLKELELRHSDYIEYPEIISLRTIAESMINSQIPYMWTIQEGNYTNEYGYTYEVAYIIGKTPEKGIFYDLYHPTGHEYNTEKPANYNSGETKKRAVKVYQALVKVCEKWQQETPELTIFTVLNAYDKFVHNPDNTHKDVNTFARSMKKTVRTYAIGA